MQASVFILQYLSCRTVW